MPGWYYIWETLTIKKLRNEDKTPLGRRNMQAALETYNRAPTYHLKTRF